MTDPNFEIVATYCLLDDFKPETPRPDCRQRTSDAGIATCALFSALYFDFNHQKCMRYLQAHHGCCRMEKSQFCRRLARLAPFLEAFCRWVSGWRASVGRHYALDSFPVCSCRNCRIIRSKRLKGKQFRGLCASKREYFYGVKVQVVISESGMSVDWMLMEGSRHDGYALKTCWLPYLPKGSNLYADSAYQNQDIQQALLDGDDIRLLCQYKSNAKKPHSQALRNIINHYRHGIENVFSSITARFGHHLHSVTADTFALKIMPCVWASSIEWLSA